MAEIFQANPAPAFAELEDEERELANDGMSDYVSALAKIDGE